MQLNDLPVMHPLAIHEMQKPALHHKK